MIATRAGEALFARAHPEHQMSDAARSFSGLTIPDLARDCLRRAGVSTTGLSVEGLVTRAMHTTSDYPLILGDTMNRVLRRAYNAAPAGIMQVARQSTARDFRAKHALMFGAGPQLEEVKEGGEFKHGTIEEAGESLQLVDLRAHLLLLAAGAGQ